MKRDVALLLGGTVLGAIGTLLVNLATGWFQAEEPRLVFEANETLPIQAGDQSTAIYHITLDNTGNKQAKDVVCVVTIPDAKIEKHKVKHPVSMQNTEELKGDTLIERFDAINPNDPVQISVQAVGTSPLPAKPMVDCRGEGVVGVEKLSADTQPSSGINLGWFSGIIMILLLSLTFSVMSLYGFIEQTIKNYHSLIEIEVKFTDESSIAVRTIKGFLVPKGWVKLVPYEYHRPTGHSYDDLRRLGTGKHVIQRK